MREIKFLVWDEGERAMISPDHIDREGYAHWTCHSIPQATRENIRQYTGLHDKNGKEIYEGDVVKIPNWSSGYSCKKCGHKESRAGIAEISFSNESISEYGCRAIATFTKKIDCEEYPLGDVGGCEVIGNIYENPELLEEKK